MVSIVIPLIFGRCKLLIFLTSFAFFRASWAHNINDNLVTFYPEVTAGWDTYDQVPCEGIIISKQHIETSKQCADALRKQLQTTPTEVRGNNSIKIAGLARYPDNQILRSVSGMKTETILALDHPLYDRDVIVHHDIVSDFTEPPFTKPYTAHYIGPDGKAKAMTLHLYLTYDTQYVEYEYPIISEEGFAWYQGVPVLNNHSEIVCIMSSDGVCARVAESLYNNKLFNSTECKLNYFACANYTFTACNGDIGIGQCHNYQPNNTWNVAVFPNGFRDQEQTVCNSDKGCEIIYKSEDCEFTLPQDLIQKDSCPTTSPVTNSHSSTQCPTTTSESETTCDLYKLVVEAGIPIISALSIIVEFVTCVGCYRWKTKTYRRLPHE